MSGDWKSKLQKHGARIDGLSLRERVFLFLSVLATFFAFADAMWLSPAQANHKQVTQRFERQGQDLKRVREALMTMPKPIDAGAVINGEIAYATARLDEVNQTIADLFPSVKDEAPLAQAMVHLLRRHDGLTLVRTSSVDPDVSTGQGAVGAGTAPPVLSRRGVILTVAGPYAELIRYVQTLEKALPQARWGTMSLESEKLPPELTLKLFLVGVRP